MDEAGMRALVARMEQIDRNFVIAQAMQDAHEAMIRHILSALSGNEAFRQATIRYLEATIQSLRTAKTPEGIGVDLGHLGQDTVLAQAHEYLAVMRKGHPE